MDPLAGTRVLDLSTAGPGPRCTGLLADLGAEVVRIGRPPGSGAVEPPWHAYSAGRRVWRSALDLKDPEDLATFLDLAASADVVVETFRPGVADRLGVGYEAVRARNPAVVYASLTGYGQDGPYAGRAGHDLNYLAVGGFLATQGRRADGGPAIPGATVADSAGGGMHAALAILAALHRRGQTGSGAHLDVSAVDGVLALMSLHIDGYLATGDEPSAGTTLLTGRYACYDVYPARDGRWLAVAAIEAAFFANLCRALGLEEWIPHQYDDARQDEIRNALRTAFEARDRDSWVEELADAETCVSPVLSIAEVTEDPHLAARGAFGEVAHPGHGRVRQVAPVIAGSRRHEVEQVGDEPTSAVWSS